MNNISLPKWLLPVIGICAVLSLISIGFRYRMESRHKVTEIALEIETVQNLASAQGLSVAKGLEILKDNHLGSLVLSEKTLADLLNSRQIDMTVSRDGADFKILEPDPAEAETIRRRVLDAIARRLPSMQTTVASNGTIQLRGALPSLVMLRTVSVGLDPEEVSAARNAHLRIIARFANPEGASDDYIEKTLQEAAHDGATVYLPVGDQVLGRRNAMTALEGALARNNMFFASPEFAKLGGGEEVVKDIPAAVLPLHSAQVAELDKLPFSEAVDRYAKAARERDERILLLRPWSESGNTPLSDLAGFVKAVRNQVQAEGGVIGTSAKPFTDPGVPWYLFLAIGLAMIAPVAFGLTAMIPWRQAKIAGLVLALLLAAACYSEHYRFLMAFAGTLALPIIAFLWLDEHPDHPWPITYLVVTLISLVGGLCVAGLLNTLPYFVRAQQFEGVKVAVFLPVAVIAVHAFARLGNLRTALKSPITYQQALIGLVILGALAFMISRTGNDNPAGVSSFEIKMRDILDRVLFVRPRTKEFLFGHPFLIIGIGLLSWIRKNRKSPLAATVTGWAALALMMGAIGQTDVVNTLCHIHTSILLSVERIAVGWLVGGIFGLLGWWIVSTRLPKIEGDLA
jgi:hypothetical protein